MNLYEVTNGFIGEAYVKCFVVALNEEYALKLSYNKYKNHSMTGKYGKKYYCNLKCDLLLENIDFIQQCTEIRDY